MFHRSSVQAGFVQYWQNTILTHPTSYGCEKKILVNGWRVHRCKNVWNPSFRKFNSLFPPNNYLHQCLFMLYLLVHSNSNFDIIFTKSAPLHSYMLFFNYVTFWTPCTILYNVYSWYLHHISSVIQISLYRTIKLLSCPYLLPITLLLYLYIGCLISTTLTHSRSVGGHGEHKI